MPLVTTPCSDVRVARIQPHPHSITHSITHSTQDLSWGIGVSLGSPAAFDCLPAVGKPQRVMIRSGDILVGEFGQMPHAVSVPRGEPPPAWWGKVDSFGNKQRCNVLFRQAMTEKQQRKLAEERSQKVYGMSLKELRAKTGKDNAFLSVHLRHAALE